MKKIIVVFIFVLIIIGPSFTQTILNKRIKSTSLEVPKVLILGNVTYTGTISTIKTSLQFYYKYRPLKNLKVKLNNLVLKLHPSGEYKLISRLNTKLKRGDTIIFTAESKNHKYPFRKKVVFATYKNKHYLKLISPTHNQEIDLSENPPFVKIKWDFFNYSGRVGLIVRRVGIMGNSGEIVDVYLNTNEYNLDPNLLLPSEEYSILIYSYNNPDARLGYFKLSKYCTNDSEIQYRFRNVSKFKTK